MSSNRAEIACIAADIDNLRSELAALDENLVRAHLSDMAAPRRFPAVPSAASAHSRDDESLIAAMALAAILLKGTSLAGADRPPGNILGRFGPHISRRILMALSKDEKLKLLKMASEVLPHALKEPQLYADWLNKEQAGGGKPGAKSALRALYAGFAFTYRQLDDNAKTDKPAKSDGAIKPATPKPKRPDWAG